MLGDDLDPPASHCSRFGRTAQRRGSVTVRRRRWRRIPRAISKPMRVARPMQSSPH